MRALEIFEWRDGEVMTFRFTKSEWEKKSNCDIGFSVMDSKRKVSGLKMGLVKLMAASSSKDDVPEKKDNIEGDWRTITDEEEDDEEKDEEENSSGNIAGTLQISVSWYTF